MSDNSPGLYQRSLGATVAQPAPAPSATGTEQPVSSATLRFPPPEVVTPWAHFWLLFALYAVLAFGLFRKIGTPAHKGLRVLRRLLLIWVGVYCFASVASIKKGSIFVAMSILSSVGPAILILAVWSLLAACLRRLSAR